MRGSVVGALFIGCAIGLAAAVAAVFYGIHILLALLIYSVVGSLSVLGVAALNFAAEEKEVALA